MKNSKKVLSLIAMLVVANAISGCKHEPDIEQPGQTWGKIGNDIGNGITVYGCSLIDRANLDIAWDEWVESGQDMSNIINAVDEIHMVDGTGCSLSKDNNGKNILKLGTGLSAIQVGNRLGDILYPSSGKMLDNSRETVRMAMKFVNNSRGA